MIKNVSKKEVTGHINNIVSSINTSGWQPTLIVAMYCENTTPSKMIADIFAIPYFTIKLSNTQYCEFDAHYNKMLSSTIEQHCGKVLIFDAKNQTVSRFSKISKIIVGKTASIFECVDSDYKADFVSQYVSPKNCFLFYWL